MSSYAQSIFIYEYITLFILSIYFFIFKLLGFFRQKRTVKPRIFLCLFLLRLTNVKKNKKKQLLRFLIFFIFRLSSNKTNNLNQSPLKSRLKLILNIKCIHKSVSDKRLNNILQLNVNNILQLNVNNILQLNVKQYTSTKR